MAKKMRIEVGSLESNMLVFISTSKFPRYLAHFLATFSEKCDDRSFSMYVW